MDWASQLGFKIDARHGNEAVDGLRPLRHPRRDAIAERPADTVERSEPVGDTAALQADLTDQRGKAQRRPVDMLAVMRPLQGPAQRQETARRGQGPGQFPNLRRRNAGDRLGPWGDLRDRCT